VLVGDGSITTANCSATCETQVASCTNKAGVLSCAESVACNSIPQYRTDFDACGSSDCNSEVQRPLG
jgi:hypothetical protein